MNRRFRIAFELLGPPLVASVCFTVFELAISGDSIFVTPKAFLFSLIFAYVFAAIPSVIFTLVMELSFAKGLEVRSWRAVILASALGLLSGIAIALAFARGFDNQRGAFFMFPALGALTGALTGLIVLMSSKKTPNRVAGSD